jgi:hypothetical protein
MKGANKLARRGVKGVGNAAKFGVNTTKFVAKGTVKGTAQAAKVSFRLSLLLYNRLFCINISCSQLSPLSIPSILLYSIQFYSIHRFRWVSKEPKWE